MGFKFNPHTQKLDYFTKKSTSMTGSDAAFILQDDGDSTKQLAFQLSGISTGKTRTLRAPNKNGTIALTSDVSASPLTTKGDLYTYDTDDQRLAIGADGLVLTADAAEATGMKWAAAGTSSPLTTKGDLYTYDADNQRLAIGADGLVLTADAAEATGMKWAAAGGGGGLWTEASNTDVDTGTETVDTFDPDADGMGVWHCLVSNGANICEYTVNAAWDDSLGTVEYRSAKTVDLGDTSDLVLAVDMDAPAGSIRLRATAASDDWSVKVIRYYTTV